ncbi:UNVERIFIED_CONTAM: hypothetical protein Sradi_3198900 [Sesamum radiatum]|uniref:Uncharacterized protein n=1 Tax=Sesamum radiatum TaxID=300843 RepID=A0AAW2RFW0_SESRA
MEGLEKLEQVQRTICLLHSVGISDSNPDSERFLADFTFLLMQRCGELDITSKCELISKHMSKDVDSKLGAKSVRMFRKDPFRPLLIVLERQGLLTERIEEELRCGEEYWALERELCSALVSNKEAKFITEAEEKYDGLLKALDPELSMKYQKRCEEATSEGTISPAELRFK